MRARIALLAAVIAGLGACTDAGSSGAPVATNAATPTPTHTTSPTPISNPVGYPTQSLKCPTKPTSEPDQPHSDVTGQVLEYLICPMKPGVWGPPFSPYGLNPSAPSGGKPFTRVDAVLRLPDETTSSDEGCPTFVQAPRTILVKTTEGRWQVHLPVDDCGTYLPQVTKALSKIGVPL